MSASSQPPSETATDPAVDSRGSRVFDFVKKKRWADLILAEASDSVPLILNQSMMVLWCGGAIPDALGWGEADFLNSELTEYLKGEGDIKECKAISDDLPYTQMKTSKHSERCFSRVWRHGLHSTYKFV